MYIHIHTYLHAHIHVCVNIYIYIHTHVYIYIYVYMYISYVQNPLGRFGGSATFPHSVYNFVEARRPYSLGQAMGDTPRGLGTTARHPMPPGGRDASNRGLLGPVPQRADRLNEPSPHSPGLIDKPTPLGLVRLLLRFGYGTQLQSCRYIKPLTRKL